MILAPVAITQRKRPARVAFSTTPSFIIGHDDTREKNEDITLVTPFIPVLGVWAAKADKLQFKRNLAYEVLHVMYRESYHDGSWFT